MDALGTGDRRPIAEDERRKAWVERSERLRDAQRGGRVQDLDAEYLVLALMALTMFPLAFPQLVRMVTGARVSDAAFQQRQTRFLRRLGGPPASRFGLGSARGRPSRGLGSHRPRRGHRKEGGAPMSSVPTALLERSTAASTDRGEFLVLRRVALWVMLAANILAAWGVQWDIQWHTRRQRGRPAPDNESAPQPAHPSSGWSPGR
jgi:hypothetical protein